jgi:hypothetical protein
MLTCYDNKIFVYGCYGPQIYDTTAHTWLKTSFPVDTIAGRWDGVISRYGNDLFVFGAPGFNKLKFYNVVKMDLSTLAYQMLQAPLPIKQYDAYPAYAQKDDKLLIVYPHADSVYLFDFVTQKGRFAAQNILKASSSNNFVPYTFGKYQDYLYVYNNQTAELKRISLNSYIWETVFLPAKVRDFLSGYNSFQGAVFDGILLLFSYELNAAVCCDLQTGEWGNGNFGFIPFPTFETRFTNDSEFYFLDSFDTKIWKVTLVH